MQKWFDNFCDKILSIRVNASSNWNRNIYIVTRCIYKAREMVDLLGTFRRYLSRGRLREIYTRAGLHETLITAETYVNPFPEIHVDVSDPLPSLHCFAGATFFHLQLPSFHPASLPSSPPFLHHSRCSHSPFLFTGRAASASGIRYIRGSLCFMANCFIIFDIFPVYGRGSAFCFMAVYCAWWTSLYMPPWILGSTSGSCFIRETLVVSNTR